MNTPWRSMTRDERLQWLLSHWRAFVPALSSGIVILLMTMPLLLPSPALPHFAFLAVAAWCLFQPDLMPSWVAFLLGLLTDAMLSLPFGTNATLLPLVTAALGAIGRYFGPRPFALDWALIGILALVYALLQWLLICFVGGALPFQPLLLQALTTIAAWPAAVGLCARLQRGWALP